MFNIRKEKKIGMMIYHLTTKLTCFIPYDNIRKEKYWYNQNQTLIIYLK